MYRYLQVHLNLKTVEALSLPQGVTFIFTGDKQTYLDCLDKLNVKIVKSGDTDFLGYTNYFDGGVHAYDKKVNVQGYFDGQKIFIGTPLLLGSY